MNVKEIIKYACTYMQYDSIYNYLNTDTGTLTDDETKDLNLLLSCVNLVNNLIATDYIRLYDTKTITNSSGVIHYGLISVNVILDIIAVYDNNGNKIPFKITEDGIETMTGTVKIKYAFYPNSVTLTGTISNYKLRINERIFAYGVVGEYLFIKGNIDDASMWDARFKAGLLSSTRKKSEIKIPTRRWE